MSAFITHLVYLKGTSISVDVKRISVRYPVLIIFVLFLDAFARCQGLGVKCVQVQGEGDLKPKFDAKGVRDAILELSREDDTP